MPNVLVRDLPKNVYNHLKESAERNHRSLSKELLVLIERSIWLAEPPRRLDLSKRPPRMEFIKLPDLSPEAINAAIDEGQE